MPSANATSVNDSRPWGCKDMHRNDQELSLHTLGDRVRRKRFKGNIARSLADNVILELILVPSSWIQRKFQLGFAAGKSWTLEEREIDETSIAEWRNVSGSHPTSLELVSNLPSVYTTPLCELTSRLCSRAEYTHRRLIFRFPLAFYVNQSIKRYASISASCVSHC
jgi:hypothetical protein